MNLNLTRMATLAICFTAWHLCPAQTPLLPEQAPTVQMLDKVDSFVRRYEPLCDVDSCHAAFRVTAWDVREARAALATGSFSGMRLDHWKARYGTHFHLVVRHLMAISARTGQYVQAWSAGLAAEAAIKNDVAFDATMRLHHPTLMRVDGGGPGQQVNCNDLAAVLSGVCGLNVVTSPVAAAICEAVVIEQWAGDPYAGNDQINPECGRSDRGSALAAEYFRAV